MNKQLAAVILYGVVAVIWLALCAADLMHTGRVDGVRVLATVVWGFGYVVLQRRYLRQR